MRLSGGASQVYPPEGPGSASLAHNPVAVPIIHVRVGEDFAFGLPVDPREALAEGFVYSWEDGWSSKAPNMRHDSGMTAFSSTTGSKKSRHFRALDWVVPGLWSGNSSNHGEKPIGLRIGA